MSDVLELENEIYQDEPEQSTEQVEEEFIAPVLNQHSGVERGKFRSLTLINWNGFFARTFDLDELCVLRSIGYHQLSSPTNSRGCTPATNCGS